MQSVVSFVALAGDKNQICTYQISLVWFLLLLQFEKRRDSLASSHFELQQKNKDLSNFDKHCSDARFEFFLFFYNCNTYK